MKLEEVKAKVDPIFQKELERAFQKHPQFPKSLDGGLAIITEEYMEMCKEVNDCMEAAVSYEEVLPRILSETLQVAVTAFRFAAMTAKKMEDPLSFERNIRKCAGVCCRFGKSCCNDKEKNEKNNESR